MYYQALGVCAGMLCRALPKGCGPNGPASGEGGGAKVIYGEAPASIRRVSGVSPWRDGGACANSW